MPINDKNIKEISIDDVRTGMVLEDVIDSSGVLIFSGGRTLKTDHEIEAIKKLGIKYVYINTLHGVDVEETTPSDDLIISPSSYGHYDDEEKKSEERYFRNIEKAASIRNDAISKTKEVLLNIRKTGDIPVKEFYQTSEGIVSDILKNPDALISITQLKGYDEYTYTHSVNVCILITTLAKSMGYSNDQLLEIGFGGLLHDIGKMCIPERILNKPGKLTESEFAEMKRHSMLGFELIKDKKDISELSRRIIVQHHERMNGTGYPFGLKGGRIHEISSLASVADVYDALTSDRVYKQGWPPQKALALIYRGRNTDYPEQIVDLFTKHVGIYPVGSFVELVSGDKAVVVYVDNDHVLDPKIKIIMNKEGVLLKNPSLVDVHLKKKNGEGELYAIKTSLDPRPFNIHPSNYIIS